MNSIKILLILGIVFFAAAIDKILPSLPYDNNFNRLIISDLNDIFKQNLLLSFLGASLAPLILGFGIIIGLQTMFRMFSN